jgi:hypothetical protein
MSELAEHFALSPVVSSGDRLPREKWGNVRRPAVSKDRIGNSYANGLGDDLGALDSCASGMVAQQLNFSILNVEIVGRVTTKCARRPPRDIYQINDAARDWQRKADVFSAVGLKINAFNIADQLWAFHFKEYAWNLDRKWEGFWR